MKRFFLALVLAGACSSSPGTLKPGTAYGYRPFMWSYWVLAKESAEGPPWNLSIEGFFPSDFEYHALRHPFPCNGIPEVRGCTDWAHGRIIIWYLESEPQVLVHEMKHGIARMNNACYAHLIGHCETEAHPISCEEVTKCR